jgi:2-oxopent-4-enoate/cis-2-oxohex-4-enoate hydratase
MPDREERVVQCQITEDQGNSAFQRRQNGHCTVAGGAHSVWTGRFEGLSYDKVTIRQYGDELYDAWLDRRVLSPLLERAPDISLSDAYAVQLRLVNRRVQAGETIIGKKIGLTSKPIQDFLGVFEPDFGQLTSRMLSTEDQGIDLDQLIQPKAEAELAFVLNEDLIGPGITATDVIRATDYVSPCFEIVDSRIRDWG